MRTIICTQGTGLAKEELTTVEGKINVILPNGRFGATFNHEHRIFACAAGKMPRHQIRSLFGDHVRMESVPYDLTKVRSFTANGQLAKGRAEFANVS